MVVFQLLAVGFGQEKIKVFIYPFLQLFPPACRSCSASAMRSSASLSFLAFAPAAIQVDELAVESNEVDNIELADEFIFGCRIGGFG
jgi:hypothetical protein